MQDTLLLSRNGKRMTPAQRLAAIEKRRKKELETLQSLVTDENVDWLISRIRKLELANIHLLNGNKKVMEIVNGRGDYFFKGYNEKPLLIADAFNKAEALAEKALEE